MANYRSVVGSYHEISPKKQYEKPMKISSIVSTEDSIYGTFQNQSITRKQKCAMLKETIQEKIKKMKLVCETVRSKNINSKTLANHENYILCERIQKRDPNTSFKKSKEQSPTQQQQQQQPKLVLFNLNGAPKARRYSFDCFQKQLEYIHGLKEVRQIQSFMMDQDYQQDQSIVQQHGIDILNMELCKGKISQFKIIKYLDEGKFGKVFLAQSHINGVIYSIKSIYRHSMDETAINQLIRQVKIQSFTNHPHIVKLYNFFVDDDCAYLVLQPCMGKNLFQNLKEKGKIPEDTVRQLIRQLCSAVSYLHKNDILHRDLKPQNILLHDNMVKVCDFGWAVHSPLMRVTQCGTPLYTSPEIVSKVPYDNKIDVWSIGILTYELLYGTIPFQIRNIEDLNKIIEQQVVFSSRPFISREAINFMKICLKKNPIERANIQQLVQHEFLRRQEKYRMTIA